MGPFQSGLEKFAFPNKAHLYLFRFGRNAEKIVYYSKINFWKVESWEKSKMDDEKKILQVNYWIEIFELSGVEMTFYPISGLIF